MKVGIMQPYFLPYLGYFSLIKHTDEFILFDTPQFIYHGWIERNRILKPNDGWQYIAVPLKKHSRLTAIKDIEINNDLNWRERMLAQIQHYKKAPYFRFVRQWLEQVLNHPYNNIAEINQATLRAVCDYLGFSRELPLFSEMHCPIGAVAAPDEWALEICKAIHADEYWNPPGGMDFFDRSKYEAAGIDLFFHKIILQEYRQKTEVFESGLSVLDAMMFNSPAEINELLDQYELL